MQKLIADKSNYRAGNAGRGATYLVMHYTGNDGSTAKNNAAYFNTHKNLQASAHYFVDATETWQSVEERDIAWHCAPDKGRPWTHPICRNENSMGIEMCCRWKSSAGWYFEPGTVKNAVALARDIVKRYGILAANLLRHYDTSGKNCPAPWVQDTQAWADFKAAVYAAESEDEDMVRYEMVKDIPDWGKATIDKLIAAKALALPPNGKINLSDDMLRTFVINDRMGVYK
jgi:N-acetylmuramoyl-L-alanine amidase CwlA